jgi:hypothetical protein
MTRLTVFTYDLPGTFQLARNALVGVDDLVESIRNLAGEPCLVTRQSDRKIAVPYRLESPQKLPDIQLGRIEVSIATVRATVGLRTGSLASL